MQAMKFIRSQKKNGAIHTNNLWVFFLRACLTAECSITKTVLRVSFQALGSMLAIYIAAAPGCAEERAKPKPVSLQKGCKFAVLGGAGDFSEDLTDGRGIAFEVVVLVFFPPRLWQPDRSWSRNDVAKASMAACVSMALQRWIKALVGEWGRRAGAWRALVWARSLRKVAASSLQCPPTSIPKTTSRHRRSRRGSG